MLLAITIEQIEPARGSTIARPAGQAENTPMGARLQQKYSSATPAYKVTSMVGPGRRHWLEG